MRLGRRGFEECVLVFWGSVWLRFHFARVQADSSGVLPLVSAAGAMPWCLPLCLCRLKTTATHGAIIQVSNCRGTLRPSFQCSCFSHSRTHVPTMGERRCELGQTLSALPALTWLALARDPQANLLERMLWTSAGESLQDAARNGLWYPRDTRSHSRCLTSYFWSCGASTCAMEFVDLFSQPLAGSFNPPGFCEL